MTIGWKKKCGLDRLRVPGYFVVYQYGQTLISCHMYSTETTECHIINGWKIPNWLININIVDNLINVKCIK